MSGTWTATKTPPGAPLSLPRGAALGGVTAGIEAAARDVVPSAVTTSFQGTAAAFRTALKGMGWLLALAVVVIYLVLGVLYESFRMIDFAHDAQRREGLAPEAAIRQACLIRFRPIMMTTAAALMAGLPIALGYGGGGDARQPLGLAVVGGLLVSQTLTLYVTPVFFLYMERVRRGVHREPAAG